MDSKNPKRHVFNTFGDFVKQVSKPGHSENGKSSSKKASSWHMNASWDDAIRMATDGWPEGLKKMQKATELLEVPSSERNYEPQPMAALAGDEVDVGLYLSGEPECMTDWTMAETPSFGKVAKIVVNCSASCGVSTELMFRRGAAAVLLVDALESCGIRCEVWVLPWCSGEGERKPVHFCEVLAKQADDPVELDRLAYMLAHPVVMRRLGFRLMEQEKPDSWAGKETHGGYGFPSEVPALEHEEGTIYFGAQSLVYSNEEKMVLAVQELLNKFLKTDNN